MVETRKTKDEKNLDEVLQKLADMPASVRTVMQRLHDVIMTASPELKPRIWYGMPGYAKSASSPVIVFIRNDELMTLGISEKAIIKPAGGKDGLLMPCAWYFENMDETTEARVAEIVRQAVI